MPAAKFFPKSKNIKLSPQDVRPSLNPKYQTQTPRAPFCSSTYASIESTCPPCPFKGKGCYAQTGRTYSAVRLLDEHKVTALTAAKEEAAVIDDAFRGGPVPQDGERGGRDLRLHVSGDCRTNAAALILAAAAKRWKARGGGTVWTYTHAWPWVARESWGDDISVLASVESPEQAREARKRGYAFAIVVADFNSKTAFPVYGNKKAIPCPAETSGMTCVECRLCLDVDLESIDRGIAFSAHGWGQRQVKKHLASVNNLLPLGIKR